MKDQSEETTDADADADMTTSYIPRNGIMKFSPVLMMTVFRPLSIMLATALGVSMKLLYVE